MEKSRLDGIRSQKDFSIVDDSATEDTHVVERRLPNGTISNRYIETDDEELKASLIPFDGRNHEKEKLSYFQERDIALEVRNKLRDLNVRAQIFELAARKVRLQDEVLQTGDSDSLDHEAREKKLEELRREIAAIDEQFDRLLI